MQRTGPLSQVHTQKCPCIPSESFHTFYLKMSTRFKRQCVHAFKACVQRALRVRMSTQFVCVHALQVSVHTHCMNMSVQFTWNNYRAPQIRKHPINITTTLMFVLFSLSYVCYKKKIVTSSLLFYNRMHYWYRAYFPFWLKIYLNKILVYQKQSTELCIRRCQALLHAKEDIRHPWNKTGHHKFH